MQQCGLAVLAMAMGTALAAAWVAVTPDLDDIYVRVAAAGNLAGQAALAMLMMARAADRLAGRALPRARTGADATRTVQRLLTLRGLPAREAWFDDLSFIFVWTAAVLQLLLLFDPRYRDFPLFVFAVPIVCVVARGLLGDLPLAGGGREEMAAGGVLAIAAVASAIQEGAANRQAMVWTACALLLALPPLLKLRVWAWRRVPA
jgi:hypothetical protein